MHKEIKLFSKIKNCNLFEYNEKSKKIDCYEDGEHDENQDVLDLTNVVFMKLMYHLFENPIFKEDISGAFLLLFPTATNIKNVDEKYKIIELYLLDLARVVTTMGLEFQTFGINFLKFDIFLFDKVKDFAVFNPDRCYDFDLMYLKYSLKSRREFVLKYMEEVVMNEIARLNMSKNIIHSKHCLFNGCDEDENLLCNRIIKDDVNGKIYNSSLITFENDTNDVLHSIVVKRDKIAKNDKVDKITNLEKSHLRHLRNMNRIRKVPKITDDVKIVLNFYPFVTKENKINYSPLIYLALKYDKNFLVKYNSYKGEKDVETFSVNTILSGCYKKLRQLLIRSINRGDVNTALFISKILHQRQHKFFIKKYLFEIVMKKEEDIKYKELLNVLKSINNYDFKC